MEHPPDQFLSLPRLAGRLTAELIARSPQGLNPCSEYELDLRGNKIGSIENLGATQNQFDAIDLSDNEIVKCENFPVLGRVHTLTLCNNRIARISPEIATSLPMLNTLTLTNNRLTSFSDVDALKDLKRLKRLTLLGNPVSKREDYRVYVAHVLPSVTILDFQKVKQTERDAAIKQFGGKNGEKALKSARARTFEVGEVGDGVQSMEEDLKPTGPTPQQLLALKAAIANAATLEEVARLEQALTTGILPSDMKL
jgi:U2 small nuclear ribonucleoprotein A'